MNASQPAQGHRDGARHWAGAARIARLAGRAVLAVGLGGCLATAALAQQYADDDAADWKEDAVPPPPAYRTSGLVDIDMPRSSSVRMGVDPKTITINQKTGIVRYVVVARGPSAVNASYEGIRCSTGEYRVYARQVQGGEWSMSEEQGWRPMRSQGGIMVQYPLRLAQGGICLGKGIRNSVDEMVRALLTNDQELYY